MNADMKWLDNPEVFKVNQLEPHSDHCYYLDYSDMKKEKNPLLQSLNGQWEFAFSNICCLASGDWSSVYNRYIFYQCLS